MAFQFWDLGELTRRLMLGEIEHDLERGSLYLSPRLTDRGRLDWPDLLKHAVLYGDEEELAESLKGTGRLRAVEYRRGPRSRPVQVRVPHTAAETLAEGEFNRFYIRAQCRRAIVAGLNEVLVYRAKAVREPRPESQRLLGRRLNPATLLDDLRAHTGEGEPASRVPGGPNSGLSVRLADAPVDPAATTI